MKRTTASGLRTVGASYVAILIVALGLVLPSAVLLGQDTVESLPNLQRKIVAAAEKARPSVVRVAWRHDDWEDSGSGVILTADGYIATFIYQSFLAPESHYLTRIPPGQSVSIYLVDGRTVPGVAVGSFSSAKNLNFDLVKITENGVWPCAETGSAEQVKPGDTCLALGFSRDPDMSSRSYEREATVRIGHLIPWGVSGMLRSSCVIDGPSDRGGGLFDLKGQLIGIHLYQPFSDYHTLSDPTACHLDIEVVKRNWRNLVPFEPPAHAPVADATATVSGSIQDAALPPVPSPDAPELAVAAAKAREATVAIVTRIHDAPFGCSGTIITPDGYVATCAHHPMVRGAETTVYFADGRTVPAQILGKDPVLDIGLVKITIPGPWPCAAMGKTTDTKVGDPGIIAGYPNYMRKNERVPLVVRGARIADTQYASAELLSLCQVWDGDSGGGLFDVQGRLMGVLHGPAAPRKVLAYAGADGFETLWNLLVNGPSLGDPVPFDFSPTANAVRKAIEGVPPVVCEVLGDGKRRALGTLVSRDGYVLTKASELYGDISCRLADGRVLPAALRNVAREHDLAILKIDAADLPQIAWSQRQEMPVGTLVASLRNGKPPTVGIVSYPTHKVVSATGYLGIGRVKDANGGVEVEELRSWWDAPELEHPIRLGDVIVSIEGRPVPDSQTLEQLTNFRADGRGREVPFVIAGDPIGVIARRDGKELNLRFPLLSTNWDVREKTSPRNCSFPAVFDTDARLTKDMCGGPLVDCEGQVIGITIAVPVSVIHGSPVMSRVFVVPAAVARAVAEERR
jgi:S1-C subfamily serine protease